MQKSQNLPGDLVKQLHDALLKAFPSSASLHKMVRFHLDENMDTIAEGSNLSDSVYRLITWAEARGCIQSLIDGALEENPNSSDLRAVSDEINRWFVTHIPKVETRQITNIPQESFTKRGRSNITIWLAVIIVLVIIIAVVVYPQTVWSFIFTPTPPATITSIVQNDIRTETPVIPTPTPTFTTKPPVLDQPDVQSQTFTPAPLPIAIVNTDILNVREGPGTNYADIGVLKKEAVVKIIGKNVDGTWWAIDYNGETGWIFGNLVDVQHPELVQIVTNISPTPAPPTATPTESPSILTTIPTNISPSNDTPQPADVGLIILVSCDAIDAQINIELKNGTECKNVDGKQVFTFDGVDDFVQIHQSAGFQKDFTISLWLKMANEPQTRYPIALIQSSDGKESYQAGFNILILDNNNVKAQYRVIPGPYKWEDWSQNSRVNQGQWYHIVLVRDTQSHEGILYINGKQVSSHLEDTKEHDFSLEQSTIIKLGRLNFEPEKWENYLNGYMYNIRIYNRALSGHEVQELCNRENQIICEFNE